MSSHQPLSVAVLLLLSAFVPLSSHASGYGYGGGFGQEISSPPAFPSLNTDSKEVLGTELRCASRDGRIKEVLSLLKQGADPNATGDFGETGLMYAARFNQRQVVEALLASGAEVNARDSKDNTALEEASKNCSYQVSSLLLSRHSDVNWINSEGKTALITAAEDGCEKIVQQLIKVPGIRLNEKDNLDRTALDYALEQSQVEVGGPYTRIALLLHRAGARTSEFVIVAPKPAAETPGAGQKKPL